MGSRLTLTNLYNLTDEMGIRLEPPFFLFGENDPMIKDHGKSNDVYWQSKKWKKEKGCVPIFYWGH